MANYDVTAAGSEFEFDTTNGIDNSCILIDSYKVFNAWSRSGAGYCQIFDINSSTYGITAESSAFQFSTDADQISTAKLDDTHIIIFWRGLSDDGFCRVVEISNVDWSISFAGTELEFDTTNCTTNSCCLMDSYKVINFWAGLDTDGYTQVFTINNSTWVITAEDSALEFDIISGTFNSCCKLDTTHAFNAWRGSGNHGYAQVFEINETTNAVTKKSTALEFETSSIVRNSCCLVDTNLVIIFHEGVSNDGFVQTFSVDPSTYAITANGTVLEYDITQGSYPSCILVDTYKVMNIWGSSTNGYAQVFDIDISTKAVIANGSPFSFESGSPSSNSSCQVIAGKIVNFWAQPATLYGFSEVLSIEGVSPSAGGTNFSLFFANNF